jgi:hypothetical protein
MKARGHVPSAGRRRSLARLGAAAFAVIGVRAAADDGTPAPAAPSFSAYVDGSYNHLSGTGRFTSGTPDHVFDTNADGFSLQQAAVNLAYQPAEGLGGVVNVVAGNDALVIKSYGYGGSDTKIDPTQVFVQWSHAGFTLMAGKYVTLAGAEVITSPADTNFSRSILFGYAVPFTHTGIRATLAPSEAVTFYAGVNNGWDDVKDTNGGKTVELGASLTPSKSVNVAIAGYVGEERIGGLVDSGPQGQRSLLDVVATWTASEALIFILDLDRGRQVNGAANGGTAGWSGVAGYLNYSIDEHWRASLRAEYFDDSDGYRTGVAQTWRELTATLAYGTKRWELRAELRSDSSTAPAFASTAAPAATHGQQSAGLEALLKF